MPGWTEPLSYSFFVSAALKSAAVLGAAWVVTLLLYRQSAAVRHLIWTAAFAELLVLPLFSVSLPALNVPVQRAWLPFMVSFQANAVAQSGTPSAGQPSGTSATPVAKPATRSHNWPLVLLLLWSAGSLASLGQMFVSWAGIRRIRRTARPLRISNFGALPRQIERNPKLLEAERGSMPMTFGLFRPAIFIPADAAQWNEERRRVVLLHEWAHVQRLDTATHLLARTVLGIYWWNPLAWIAWREFLTERERAADDLVLSFGSRAAEYATHLLEIARSMHSAPAMGWAAVAMARPRQLEGRLEAILDTRRSRRAVGRATAVGAVALAIATVAPLAALRTQESTNPVGLTDPDATIRTASTQKNPEMLDKAAEFAEAQGKFDVAQKLLDASLTIRGQVSGLKSTQYGVGLVALGDLAREQGKFDQAKTFYMNALNLLGAGADAATALIHLGTASLATKEFDQAMGDFTRAQSLNDGKASEAAVWMAIAQQRLNNFDKADSFYQAAVAAEDPNSEAAAATMELYAAFLEQQGRQEQAKSMNVQAAAIRKQLGAQMSSQAGPNA